MRQDVPKRAEAEPQPITDLDLPIEAVFCPNHLTQGVEGHPPPGGDVEYRQGIISAKEQALVNLRIVAEVQTPEMGSGLSIDLCAARDDFRPPDKPLRSGEL